jgi:replication-associated recombination protein RarA
MMIFEQQSLFNDDPSDPHEAFESTEPEERNSTMAMPTTIHGMAAMVCLSAMHKCVRRGLERDAMQFACELGHSSKGYATMVTNRLEIISHEDVGLAEPAVIPLVATCCEQARTWYDSQKLGKWRMVVGTAIRAMCRAQKSREGDHFQASIGLRNLLLGERPEVPDFAQDMHTVIGRKKGRGLEHFRTEGTKLFPAPEEKDPYEDDCYRMWAIRDCEQR